MPTTAGFQTTFLRLTHFRKHGVNLGYRNETDYEQAAIAFFARIGYNIISARRPRENDIIYYDYLTNEFGVLTRIGSIRTYFKPSTAKHRLPRNLDYYLVNGMQI